MQENNKLIAEFMGLIESSIPNYFWTQKSIEGFGTGEMVKLLYHSDWNWLMQVIDKIETLSYRRGRHFYLYLDYAKAQIRVDRMNVNLFSAWGTSSGIRRMGAVYDAVVGFIKWYNLEQKKIKIQNS